MKSPFQTILVIVSIAIFIIAIIVFSGLFSSGTKNTQTNTPQGNVVIWGILPAEKMQSYIDNFNISNVGYTLSYSEHSPQNLAQDLIVALANNTPPDVIIHSSENLSQIKDRLYVTPYAAYAERTFRDTNIDGAQLFLDTEGVVSMPLLVDPLVVYYNKDILAGSNFVVPPKTWTTLSQTVPVFTKKDNKNNLIQSTIALGLGKNVRHAQDILSALFLQTGNSIAMYNPTTKLYTVTLGETKGGEVDTPPTAQALDFYTSFANPTNSNYSWNNSQVNSLDYFLAGRSVFYIGRASELFTIQERNPNLNFDVTDLFQLENATRPITFGSFIAASITKKSANPVAAYAAVTAMSSKDGIDAFSKLFSLAPARRDLLLVQQQNPYVAVFFRAALSAFSWPDPSVTKSSDIFATMISDVTSGRSSATTAIYDAARDLQSLIR